ncbi:MAG: hypothetical protein BEN19_02220 [Epulopiscium sp. Nuni2H_MBin003]|nr:MAG: hypothetical protein BEN19_02220 [Epulopiscium sp. Nuni2H_MBin003]
MVCEGANRFETNIKRCNCCGKEIDLISKSAGHSDFLLVKKEWGYFSNKDLIEHRFNICEECYDKWIETFKLPIEEFVMSELFKGIV